MTDVVPVGLTPNDGTGIDWRAAFIAINAAFNAVSNQLSIVAQGGALYATKADITAAINGLQAVFDSKANGSDLNADVALLNSSISSIQGSITALQSAVAALQANPGGGAAPEARTDRTGTSYNVATTDTFVSVNNITAPFAAQLPLAANYPINKRLVIFDGTGSATAANQISALAASGDTIEGQPSASIGTPYGKLVLTSNGAKLWLIVS